MSDDHTRRTDAPRRLRDSLAAVSRELGLPDPVAFDLVLRTWPSAVGEHLARRARPRQLRDGLLTVEVRDGAWATQLRYLEEQIVACLRDAGADVRGVRAVVARGA